MWMMFIYLHKRKTGYLCKYMYKQKRNNKERIVRYLVDKCGVLCKYLIG